MWPTEATGGACCQRSAIQCFFLENTSKMALLLTNKSSKQKVIKEWAISVNSLNTNTPENFSIDTKGVLTYLT